MATPCPDSADVLLKASRAINPPQGDIHGCAKLGAGLLCCRLVALLVPTSAIVHFTSCLIP